MDAGAQRMREFQPEVNRHAADAADLLRGVDFLLVGFKLPPLRAVVIGAQVRFARSGSCSVRHGVLLSQGMKKAPFAECLVYLYHSSTSARYLSV